MSDDRPVHASGTLSLGGDLPVHRLGYGAMRITGDGIWGPPKDHDEALRVLRRRRRARRRLHRHGRLVRPVRLRGPDPRGAAPVRRRRHRHQGRPDAQRPERLGAGRPAGVPPAVRRDEPAPPGGRADRPVAAAPHRRQGPGRGVARRDQGAAGRRQDQARRPVRGLRGRDRAGPQGRRGGLRAEPLQPGQPPVRGGPLLLREGGHRLHPVVPGRGRRPGQAGRPARRDGQGARGDARPAGTRLAAAPLAGDAADPGHQLRRAPRGELRRSAASSSPTRSTTPSRALPASPAAGPPAGPACGRSAGRPPR